MDRCQLTPCRAPLRLTLARGDVLVKQGEANARHFYIVYSGGMDVSVQKEG